MTPDIHGRQAARGHLLVTLLAAAAAGLVLTLPAHGQAPKRMYKCTDAKGKVYVTQTPPPECLGRPTDVLNSRGAVVARDEGALTAEQAAQRDEEKKRKAEQDAAAKEERRRSAALLNTYSNERDIEDARARALKENDAAIKQTETKIADVLKRQKQLEGEKEFYVKKGLPGKLQDDLRNNEIELKNQQELLEAKKKQSATINAKYDDDKKRYLELTRSMSKR